jgi:hypothetical protein
VTKIHKEESASVRIMAISLLNFGLGYSGIASSQQANKSRQSRRFPNDSDQI